MSYLGLISGKLCVLGFELNVEEIISGFEDVRLQFVQLALVGQTLFLKSVQEEKISACLFGPFALFLLWLELKFTYIYSKSSLRPVCLPALHPLFTYHIQSHTKGVKSGRKEFTVCSVGT